MNNKIIERLSRELEKEQAKLKALLKKQSETEAEIKAKKSDIAELKNQLKAEKLNTVANLLGKNGISVDDLLSAADTGDFLTMQDKLEDNQKTVPTVAETESYTTTAE